MANPQLKVISRPHPVPHEHPKWNTVELLADLTESDRQLLFIRGQIMRFDEGKVLLEQGERQDSLFIILEGSLRVRCYSPYSIIDLAVLAHGDSFGEMGLLDPLKASASVTATEPGVLWAISREQFLVFARENFLAGMAVYRAAGVLLTRRLRRTEDRLIRCSERPVGFDYDY